MPTAAARHSFSFYKRLPNADLRPVPRSSSRRLDSRESKKVIGHDLKLDAVPSARQRITDLPCLRYTNNKAMAITVLYLLFFLSFTTPGYCKATARELIRELDHLIKDIKEISDVAEQDTKDKHTLQPSSDGSEKAADTTNTAHAEIKRGKYTNQCAEGFIPCGGVGPQCIRVEYLCDGFRDCYADGWDEDPANCGSIQCPHNMLKCNGTGRCIRRHDMCNDVDDCGNLEDENIQNCGVKRCGHSSTKCSDANLCVPNEYWCDGSKDCPNGEDEKLEKCSQVPCDGVRCKNGKCIHGDLYCDGFPDCDDGSDEDIIKCGPVRCPPYTEKCGSANYCYREPRWRTCDGHPDCPNGADERAANCIPVEYEPEQWYSYGEEGPNNNKILNILSRILKSKP